MAEDEKNAGNEAFKRQKYEEALIHYSKAIALDASNHVYFSNRAQVYINLRAYDKAIEDSETAIKLDPSFTRAYCRKAMAQYEMEQFEQAEKTIEEGLVTTKGNQNQSLS